MENSISAIPFGVYQTFGKRSYRLFLAKWLNGPITFLFVAVFIFIIGRMGIVTAQYAEYVSTGALLFLGLSIFMTIFALIASKIVYKSHAFCISDDAFKIKKGILTQREISIPYRQIQNVDVQRTLFQQIFGVSTIVIFTAGHDDEKTEQIESRGILSNVDKEIGSAIQDELLRRADVQKVIHER